MSGARSRCRSALAVRYVYVFHIARANPYELKICPWDAIEMVPTEYLPQAVTEIGGPSQYVRENRQRLIDAAQAPGRCQNGSTDSLASPPRTWTALDSAP